MIKKTSKISVAFRYGRSQVKHTSSVINDTKPMTMLVQFHFALKRRSPRNAIVPAWSSAHSD